MLIGKRLTSRRKELALVWVGLHEYGSNQTNEASEEAFKEEDMTPGVQSHRHDAEFGNPDETSSQQTTESTRKRTGRDEDTNAEKQFVPLVEA